MIVDLLDAIGRYPNYSRVRVTTAIGNITWTTAQSILAILNDCGFVKQILVKKRKRLRLTAKGHDWLQRAKQLLQEINYE